MSFDVNPFEPWRPRPTPDEQEPPPFELPPPRHADPEEDELREPPWGHSHLPPSFWAAPEPPSRGWGLLFVWVTAGLVVLALVVWAANGGSHVTRVAASTVAAWVGLLFALLIGSQWRWYSRVGWAAVGVVGLVLCWLFVPTTEGNNYWQAQSILARTRELPAGELEAFTAEVPRRREIANDFRHLRAPLLEAERDWMRRTVQAEIVKAKGADPVAALARLREVKAAIRAADRSFGFVQSLTEVQQEVFAARLEVLKRELNGMTEKGRYKEAAGLARAATVELDAEAHELGMARELTEGLREWRKRNVLAWARAAEVVLKKLESDGKYVEVAVDGARCEAELIPDAWENFEVRGRPAGRFVDAETEEALERLRACRRRALGARLRLASADLDALLAKGEDEQVSVRARQFEDEFRGENEALHNPSNPSAAFLPTRQKALSRRAERAATSLQDLLTRKDYAAVALRGTEATRQLEPEGSAVGKSDWREPILSVRRTALDARLEQCREATQQDLRNRRYHAIGETGEKTYTDLAAEAEAVGRLGEVAKFRASCRVIAKLAKAGNAEGEK